MCLLGQYSMSTLVILQQIDLYVCWCSYRKAGLKKTRALGTMLLFPGRLVDPAEPPSIRASSPHHPAYLLWSCLPVLPLVLLLFCPLPFFPFLARAESSVFFLRIDMLVPIQCCRLQRFPTSVQVKVQDPGKRNIHLLVRQKILMSSYFQCVAPLFPSE